MGQDATRGQAGVGRERLAAPPLTGQAPSPHAPAQPRERAHFTAVETESLRLSCPKAHTASLGAEMSATQSSRCPGFSERD